MGYGKKWQKKLQKYLDEKSPASKIKDSEYKELLQDAFMAAGGFNRVVNIAKQDPDIFMALNKEIMKLLPKKQLHQVDNHITHYVTQTPRPGQIEEPETVDAELTDTRVNEHPMEAYCTSCKSKQDITEPYLLITKIDTKFLQGKCSHCEARISTAKPKNYEWEGEVRDLREEGEPKEEKNSD